MNNMNEVSFVITAEEVRGHACRKLTNGQIEKILEVIENDSVLWKNIVTSIKDAIELVLGNEG